MIQSPIKMRHLNAFQEVARHKRLRYAAEALSITQPALSKTIRELEESLGVELFERTPQGITLTSEGTKLLRHTAPAMQSLHEGVAAIRKSKQKKSVRIGALSTVEEGLLPRVLDKAYGAMPEVRFEVETGTCANLLLKLRFRELDLVVGRMNEPRGSKDIAFEHFYHEPLVLVVNPNHPLLQLASPAKDSLEYYPWVVPSRGTSLREELEQFWVETGIREPIISLETLSLPVSRRYARKGNAIWVAPLDAVQTDLAARKLVCLPSKLEMRGGYVSLCVNAEQPLSETVESFCEQLRSVARKVHQLHRTRPPSSRKLPAHLVLQDRLAVSHANPEQDMEFRTAPL